MDSDGPAATLSMSSLTHPDIHYEQSSPVGGDDFDDHDPAGHAGHGVRCGLPAQLNGGGGFDDLRPDGQPPRRPGGTATSSPVTGTTTSENGEPCMETTSEESEEPELRSHSSNSDERGGVATVSTTADDDAMLLGLLPGECEPPDHIAAAGSPYRGRIIGNADGVIAFFEVTGGAGEPDDENASTCDDGAKFWPAFSSSYIHDGDAQSAAKVPPVLFPFHTAAVIGADESTAVAFFRLPASSPPANVLDLYQNLPLPPAIERVLRSNASPLPFSPCESQRPPLLRVCLVCSPRRYADDSTFLLHAETCHNILPFPCLEDSSQNEEKSVGIIQLDGPDGEPVIAWLRPLSVESSGHNAPVPHPLRGDTSLSVPHPPSDLMPAEKAAADVLSGQSSSHFEDDLVVSPGSKMVGQSVADMEMSNDMSEEDGEADEGDLPLRISLDEGGQGELFVGNGHDEEEDFDDVSPRSCTAEDLTADHAHHHHEHEEGGLVNGNGKSSSIECPKCDIVLGMCLSVVSLCN